MVYEEYPPFSQGKQDGLSATFLAKKKNWKSIFINKKAGFEGFKVRCIFVFIDELFQYHYKNHLLEVLHFVIPGHQCFISLADIHQQDLLI